MSSRRQKQKRAVKRAKAKMDEAREGLDRTREALAETLAANDAQLPFEELGPQIPDTGAGPAVVDNPLHDEPHIMLPTRKLSDGSFQVDLGGGQDAILKDPSSMPTAPTIRRRTIAPPIHGPKDLPGLRAHLVDRVNWLRMSNEERVLAQRDAADLAMSKLWWVSDDVARLVEASALTVPDDVSFGDIELPAHAHGFVVFPAPIATFDDWEIVAVDWHPVQFMAVGARPDPGATDEDVYAAAGVRPGETQTGIRYTWWVAPDLTAGFNPQQMTHPVGRVALQREIEMQERYHGAGRVQASLEGATWIPFGTTTWLAGTTIESDSPGEPRINYGGDQDYPSSDPRYLQGMAEATVIRKLMLSLWSISRSTKIVETRDAPEARHERRRRVREGHGTDAVQVVQLRPHPRSEGGGDGTGEGREYKHRWIVSGHFRWQAHGPDRELRKLIYIEPYLKGPEGLPLLDPAKVFKVS